MTKETLRMQMLSGVITEGEYKAKLMEFDMDQFSMGNSSSPKASFEDKWNDVPNANKEVLKKSTGKEPIKIMASSKGENYVITKGSDNKFYRYQYTQAENPGKPVGPFNSEEEAKKLNESLNENFVGMGAINNLFAERKKETYEDAFEHFLSQKYALNEVEEDLEEAEMGNIDPAIKNNPAFNKLVSYLKTHPDEAEELKDKEDEIEDVLQNVNEAFKKDGKFYTQDTYGNTKEVDFKTYLKDKGISVAMSAAALGFLGALMAGALGTNTPNEILDAVLVASGIGAAAGATLGEGEEPLKDVSDEKKAEYLVYMTGMSYEDAITAIRRGAKV